LRRKNSLILLVAFLCACGSLPEGIGTAVPARSTVTDIPSATAPIALPPVTILAPTRVSNPTATADTRLPPERWQEWPVIPSVTERAIEIYRAGQSMGLDPHAFSKVGDCQSVKAAFMGYFDIPERYSLGNDYVFLQQTIDNFAGHFTTDGQAVKGGFNAAAVLSPLWADPTVCLAGENPLECELRVTKPIIVIVSLEVWWDGRTTVQYEILMHRILDTIISHGAVPILATKADNVEGDNSLNLTTARLAYEYDLPLWNFWAAVQALPAHGMDMIRKDGFHISTEAWSTRSFTGLEALDSIWRGLQAAPVRTANPIANLTATLEMVPPSTLNPISAPTLNVSGIPKIDSEQIIFGLSKRQDGGFQSLGVYSFDLANRQLRQIFGAGVQFQAASPDGKYLLVSDESTLYRTNTDGTQALQLTDSLYPYNFSEAIWLSNRQIAAILTKTNATGISILSVDGQEINELHDLGESPVEISPSSNTSYIYWKSGSCSFMGVCKINGEWVYSVDEKMDQELTGLLNPDLSPNGNILASGAASTAQQNMLVFASADGTAPRQIPLPGNNLVEYAWSSEGDALAVVVALRSDYSGKVMGNRNFVVNPRTLDVIEYPQTNILNPRVLWSPDDTSLFWIGTIPDQNGFKITGSLVKRSLKQVMDLSSAINITDLDYLVVANAAWLPFP